MYEQTIWLLKTNKAINNCLKVMYEFKHKSLVLSFLSHRYLVHYIIYYFVLINIYLPDIILAKEGNNNNKDICINMQLFY